MLDFTYAVESHKESVPGEQEDAHPQLHRTNC